MVFVRTSSSRLSSENSDGVISGLILTKVLLENLKFKIELYLNWY